MNTPPARPAFFFPFSLPSVSGWMESRPLPSAPLLYRLHSIHCRMNPYDPDREPDLFAEVEKLRQEALQKPLPFPKPKISLLDLQPPPDDMPLEQHNQYLADQMGMTVEEFGAYLDHLPRR